MGDADRLERLAEVAAGRPDQIIEGALSAARDVLGMEISFPSRIDGDTQEFVREAGGGEPFGLVDGTDVAFVRVLARLVADEIDRQTAARERDRLTAQVDASEALIAALDARERYTAERSRSVVDLSVEVARTMRLSDKEAFEVGQVALLHDIGKVGVGDAVLNKPDELTEAEWDEMREHPAIGARIVAQVEGLAHLAPAIRAEHERWDGSGYPDGLSGDEIPLASQICFACDSYHAMTSDRPYRQAMPHRAALEELRTWSGTQFSPRVIDALLAVLGR
jgi:HD-GYP domain-containing protein (c-di-GMP phosphodiesterase class II)